MVEEDNKGYNKVNVEFLQIQAPLVPIVELALVRCLLILQTSGKAFWNKIALSIANYF